jgi:hypothetical protein
VYIPATTAGTNTDVGVTIAGTTAISGFGNGVESGDGSLTVSGTVTVSGNTGNGIALLGANDTTTTVVSITGATVQGNGGDGVFVRSTVPVTLATSTVRNNLATGVEVRGSQSTAVTGYRFLLNGGTVSGNWDRGVILSQQRVGTGMSAVDYKVAARVENATISGNGYEGLRVSDEAGGTGFTEVLIESNTISGNLTRAATAPADILAGGVFFATGAVNTPTRIILGNFIGNSVFRNGRHEIGFDVAQNNGQPWDLSSESPAVDQAMVCSASAKPNKVYCYDVVPGEDLGVAVTTGVNVKIKGMSFQNLPPTGGRDFSATIPEPTVLTPEPTQGIFLSCAATSCPAL